MREIGLVCAVAVLAVVISTGVGAAMASQPEVAVSGEKGSVVWVD